MRTGPSPCPKKNRPIHESARGVTQRLGTPAPFVLSADRRVQFHEFMNRLCLASDVAASIFHGLAKLSRNCLLIEWPQSLAGLFANASRIILENRKTSEDRLCDFASANGAKNRELAKIGANDKFFKSFKPLDGVPRRPREASRAFARSPCSRHYGRVSAAPTAHRRQRKTTKTAWEQSPASRKSLTGSSVRLTFHTSVNRNECQGSRNCPSPFRWGGVAVIPRRRGHSSVAAYDPSAPQGAGHLPI